MNNEDGKVIGSSKVYFTITKNLEPVASSSPTPTPTIPELSWLLVMPLFVVLLLVAVKLKHQKTI
jgi:hypothetical protein